MGRHQVLVFINDIDDVVEDLEGFMSKFADDSKWARKVMGEVDREKFQEGLDKLRVWSEDWQMVFNQGKCHILHLGRTNQKFEYTMGGEKLDSSELLYTTRCGHHCSVQMQLKRETECLGCSLEEWDTETRKSSWTFSSLT